MTLHLEDRRILPAVYLGCIRLRVWPLNDNRSCSRVINMSFYQAQIIGMGYQHAHIAGGLSSHAEWAACPGGPCKHGASILIEMLSFFVSRTSPHANWLWFITGVFSAWLGIHLGSIIWFMIGSHPITLCSLTVIWDRSLHDKTWGFFFFILTAFSLSTLLRPKWRGWEGISKCFLREWQLKAGFYAVCFPLP